MNDETKVEVAGGRNLAMKVPSHPGDRSRQTSPGRDRRRARRGEKVRRSAEAFAEPQRMTLQIVSTLLVMLILSPVHAQRQLAVALEAADGVKVFGTLYPAQKERPIVLLFHQAESNRGEYQDVTPTLVELGFNALAIDQRSGGELFDRRNQTVAHLQGTTGYSYDEALLDLEAAVTWAAREGYKTVIVWGSSYSAALVFLLAADHPDVAGVLAFSPEEYLSDPQEVTVAAAQVAAPVFITSSRFEADDAKAIFDAVAAADKVQFVPEGFGAHGSSALSSGDSAEYWRAVEAFLARWDD